MGMRCMQYRIAFPGDLEEYKIVTCELIDVSS